MIKLELPGWEYYHETHIPYILADGHGVLWIPRDIPGVVQALWPEPERLTNDEFEQALIEAMSQPIQEDE
jgi:hypothetical protein